MMLALLLVLAQPLNLNVQPPTTFICLGTLTCSKAGRTLTLTGGGGGGGGTPTVSCVAGQALSWNGAAWSCVSSITASTTATTAAALAADPVACGGGQYVTDINASGVLTCSTPPGTYTLPDATAGVTGGIRLTGELAGTAASPQVVDDGHNHTSATISALDTSDVTTGTLAGARGGLGAAQATCSAGDFLTCNGTTCSCSTPAGGGGGYATVQDEGSGLTVRTVLNFAGAGVACADDTTRTTCTISGGGGGSANVVETSVALSGGSGLFTQVVTGQAWVSTSSVIVCRVLGTTADGLTPEAIAVSGVQVTVSDRSAGVGYTLNLFSPFGLEGTLRVHCTGA